MFEKNVPFLYRNNPALLFMFGGENYEINRMIHKSALNQSEFIEYNSDSEIQCNNDILTDISEFSKLPENLQNISGQNELISAALVSLPGLVYMINEKGEYVMWNRNFGDILGYTKDQIKNLHHLDIYKEEDRHWINSKIEACLQNDSVVFEADIIGKNGYSDPFHISSQKLTLDGALYIINSAANISDRKDQENQVKVILQQKLVLLQEIHHRVKNNLAVISSLLYMQSLYTDQEDARKVLSESQLRIKTMALIHEQLYQSDSLSKIDYNLYLQNLSRSIRDIFDYNNSIILELKCDSFEMSLNQAVPCSLLINEIMTNAYKYAFVNTGNGKILIRVSEEGGKVTAVVKDDGIGLPDDFEEKKKKSFGFTIIETLLEQLKAEYEVRSNDGVEFIFSFELRDYSAADSIS